MSWNDRVTGAPESISGLIERAATGFFAVEVALALLILVLAALRPRSGEGLFSRIEQQAGHWLAPPWRPILAVGLLAVVARAVMLPWQGAPVPNIHDEQSLLLQAQTYLAGRLANPTHPLWEHFETFHVNQVPAYASMYFPGRGAPLALGLLLADNAWVGVWLSSVLMCMAAVWMLQAWVPAPYALLGGVLMVLRFGVFSYWINSYWGGAFTALGAMLVVGALPRIQRRPGWRMGLVMGLGATILMTTRSYEGLLLCLPVAVVLLAGLLRPTWQGGRWLVVKIALPATIAVSGGGAVLLAYNVATTGNALLSPYSLNRSTYANAPAFVISKPVTSALRGPPYFRDFYTAEGQDYFQRRSSLKSFAKSVVGKVFHTWNFYIGPVFTAAFLGGLWVLRRHRFIVGGMAFFFAGYSLVTWNFPHYTAPLLPWLLIILMRGFERLRSLEWRGRPSGLFLTRAMPAAALASLLLPASSVILGTPQLKPNVSYQACCAIPAVHDVRSRIIARLLATPGRHLVLVRDGPNNPLHYEMVYNEPDIDASRIVFARRLDPVRDAALLRYFAGRVVWEFEWRPELPEKSTLQRLGTAPLVPAR